MPVITVDPSPYLWEQNNKIISVDLGDVAADSESATTTSEILTILNAYGADIAQDELFIFSMEIAVLRYGIIRKMLVKYLITPGKGLWGNATGATALVETDLERVYFEVLDAPTDASSFVLDIGEISDQEIYSAINLHDVTGQFQANKSNYIKCKRTSAQGVVNEVYLYTGTGYPSAYGAAVDAPAPVPSLYTLITSIEELPGIVVSSDTGNEILLTNAHGVLANMASANANTSYALGGTVAGAWQKTLINAASEPTVTGATKVNGDTFVIGVNMYLVCTHNGNRAEYKFEKIAV